MSTFIIYFINQARGIIMNCLIAILLGSILDVYFYMIDQHPLLIFFYLLNANVE